MAVKTLTPALLRKIIEEEVSKFGDMEDTEKRAKDTDEVEADEFADTLEKQVDHVKALKLEEARLNARLKKISESKRVLIKKINARLG